MKVDEEVLHVFAVFEAVVFGRAITMFPVLNLILNPYGICGESGVLPEKKAIEELAYSPEFAVALKKLADAPFAIVIEFALLLAFTPTKNAS